MYLCLSTIHSSRTRYPMTKTPTPMKSQASGRTVRKTFASSSTIERTSSARSRSPVRTSRTEASTKAKDSRNKENNAKESSFDVASDMSDDEQEQEMPPTNAKDTYRPSVVHEFATKTSANEYECKICSKVRISIFFLFKLVHMLQLRSVHYQFPFSLSNISFSSCMFSDRAAFRQFKSGKRLIRFILKVYS